MNEHINEQSYPTLSYYQVAVLTECFQRTKRLSRQGAPEDKASLDYEQWEEEREYGPRYSCSGWFGQRLDSKTRMRFHRAIHALGKAGFLRLSICEPLHERRIVNMILTEAGESLANKLSEGQATNQKSKPSRRFFGGTQSL